MNNKRLAYELYRIAKMLKVAVDDPDSVNRALKEHGFDFPHHVNENSKWLNPDEKRMQKLREKKKFDKIKKLQDTYHQRQALPDAEKPQESDLVEVYYKDSEGRMRTKGIDPSGKSFGIGQAVTKDMLTTDANSGPGHYTPEYGAEDIAEVISDKSEVYQKFLSGIDAELNMLLSTGVQLSEACIPVHHLLSTYQDEFEEHTEKILEKAASGDAYNMSMVEKEVKLDMFNRLYDKIAQYLVALQPYISPNHSKVVILVNGMMLRYQSVQSKARPGSLQALAGKLNWNWSDVKKPGDKNQTDRKIYKDISKHVLELMDKKLMLLKVILQELHDDRVENVKDLTGMKQYFKYVTEMFTDSTNTIIGVEGDAVGLVQEVNPFDKMHKLSSRNVNAEFSFRRIWNTIKNAVKNAFSKAYEFIVNGLKALAQGFGIIKDAEQRFSLSVKEINAKFDEIDQIDAELESIAIQLEND